MPQRKVYLQVSFEQGMVDTIVQDYDYQDSNLKWQAPQSRAALYIENYDPNIVRGALTKRGGFALLRTTSEWNIDAGLVAGTGVPSGFTQTGVNDIDLDRYTLMIEKDPLSPDNIDNVVVCGATVVPYNRPVGQNIHIMFIRDYVSGDANREVTRILHYGVQTSDVTETPRWRNALIDGLVDTGSVRTTKQPSVFPGWEITGTFTGCARHGGVLAVTSEVAIDLFPSNGSFSYSTSWVADMYPCYVWTFWDLRRKRNDNKYWNITIESGTATLADLTDNYTTDDKYSQFKVMYPSLYVDRNTLVSWKAYTTTSVLGDCKVDTGGDITADCTTFVNDTPVAAVEFAVLEYRGRTYSTTPTTSATPEKLAETAEWLFLNEHSSHIQSLEVLRYGKSGTRVDNAFWKVQYRAIDGVGLTNGIGVIEVINTELTRGTQSRDAIIIACDLRTYLGNGIDATQGDGSDAIKEPFYWVVGVQLPNYLESKTPRPWIEGEKIPLLATFTIRGVEVIAGTYLHTVATTTYDPYPSMHWIQRTLSIPFIGETTSYAVGHKAYGAPNPLPPAIDGMWGYPLLAEQWALAKSSNVRLNGRRYIVASNIGYAYRNGSVPVTEINHYPQLVPYCYEPFNPTATGDHMGAVADGYTQIRYHDVRDNNDGVPSGAYLDNDKTGYRRNHTNPTQILVTVKIKKSEYKKLIELGVESINLYMMESGQESIFRSVGLYSVTDPPQGIYMKPFTEDLEEYNNFRLLKRYRLDGEGNPFQDTTEYAKWKDTYTGQPTDTNSWAELTNHFMATGQNLDLSATHLLTPDFTIWDYPATSPRLSLNSSGKYWKGIGAKLITNIKGRTFLGSPIDKFGDEEQGVIRYSDVQNGVISIDVFSEESFIRVGGLPHTAFMEYREQLWVFSRNDSHRLQMNNIAEPSTWEYLDKVPGQGTFSQKTVIGTPNGVVWANEAGVWLSDGRIPENIAQPVLTFFKAMATNTPPYYSTKIDLPDFPYNDQGYNPYLEVAYDEHKNEIVVISPSMTTDVLGDNGANPDVQTPVKEYRLVFNFEMKTWRIESIDLPEFGSYLNEFDSSSTTAF